MPPPIEKRLDREIDRAGIGARRAAIAGSVAEPRNHSLAAGRSPPPFA
ncbi:MAG: hypothetical protein OXI41_14115 [Chloroflexota bacterium]|nr:hypothetical protein [Chloroflexota bacterium]